jgi:CrcB protein
MQQILIVGLGGCLGAILRYKLGGLVLHHSTDWRFPLGTFVVNLLGCFLAGVVAGLIERHSWFSPNVRIFLLAGFLGGFTTFSAFGVDTVFLLRKGALAVAFAYVAASVLGGVVALWLGMNLIPSANP